MALIPPVILEGRRVRLEPMTLEHIPILAAIGLAPSVWAFTASRIRTIAEMEAYVRAALSDPHAMPFVTFAQSPSGVTAAGSTRFMNIETAHRRMEIGHTWLSPSWQRTFVNTEAKFLMLQHGFENLGYNRVEFKTDATNLKSRAALQRIGAVEEGTLRHHMVMPEGRLRDSVYYSILREEWPAVKIRLEQLLAP